MSIPAARLSEERITRAWTPNATGLLDLWRHEAPRTVRAFGFFEDADLPWRPQPAARSVSELLAHMARSYDLTAHWLTASHPWARSEPPAVRTVAEAVTTLRRAQARLFKLLASIGDEVLDQEIAPFGVRESRGVMAFGMLKHEIHHRGELHALARIRGRAVCNLYEAVPEHA